jgi:pilus assembly protein TadC
MSAWPPLLLVAAITVLPRSRTTALERLHRATGALASTGRGRAWWAGRVPLILPVLCGAAVGLLTAVVIGGGAGLVGGVVLGVATLLGARRWVRGPGAAPAEPLRLAGAWDLLAACLRAGLPVATATGCVAQHLPAADAGALHTVAGLLAVGADPVQAWEPALAVPSVAPLARAARRTARSGAAMADAVTALAADLRATAADTAAERAQRAGVLITGPLGLCFLPAFFCLGVLPVVIGLAGQLVQTW